MNLGARYVSVHRLANRQDKPVNRIWSSLHNHLHAPVWQVLHRPGNVEIPRYLQSGIPKPNTLDGTREKNFKSNGRYRLIRTNLQRLNKLATNLKSFCHGPAVPGLYR